MRHEDTYISKIVIVMQQLPQVEPQHAEAAGSRE